MRKQILKCERGLTLVELLVSMVITLIVLGGVVSVVVSSRASFTDGQEASFIQENARYAVEILSRDIRMAGGFGCADMNNVRSANVLDFSEVDGTTGDVTITPAGELFSVQGIVGYEPGVSTYPGVLSDADSAGSDAVVLRYAEPESEIPILQHSSSGDQFTFDGDHPFGFEDKLVVVDANCRQIGFFENRSNTSTVVNHEQSGSNCTGTIYPTSDETVCSNTMYSASEYSLGSSVMKLVANAYFVADSNVLPGVPALKRVALTSSGVRTDELAQGVESLELTYGVDLDAQPGGTLGDIDTFLSADQVTDWSAVGAVRFNLIFRSQTRMYGDETFEGGAGADEEGYFLNGEWHNDGYLRRLAASTVKMRNR